MILLKIFGAFAWSVIFGQLVVSLTHGADPAEIAFSQSLDLLNSFIVDGNEDSAFSLAYIQLSLRRLYLAARPHLASTPELSPTHTHTHTLATRHLAFFCTEQVPHFLALELRRFLHETKAAQTHKLRMQTIAGLPPGLTEKVAWTLNLDWITAIPCFREVQTWSLSNDVWGRAQVLRFLKHVVLAMEQQAFVAGGALVLTKSFTSNSQRDGTLRMPSTSLLPSIRAQDSCARLAQLLLSCFITNVPCPLIHRRSATLRLSLPHQEGLCAVRRRSLYRRQQRPQPSSRPLRLMGRGRYGAQAPLNLLPLPRHCDNLPPRAGT